MSQWYLTTSTGELGPYEDAELRELVGIGKVIPQSRVRRSDMGKTVFAYQIKGLFPAEPATIVSGPATPQAGPASKTPLTSASRAEQGLVAWAKRRPLVLLGAGFAAALIVSGIVFLTCFNSKPVVPAHVASTPGPTTSPVAESVGSNPVAGQKPLTQVTAATSVASSATALAAPVSSPRISAAPTPAVDPDTETISPFAGMKMLSSKPSVPVAQSEQPASSSAGTAAPTARKLIFTPHLPMAAGDGNSPRHALVPFVVALAAEPLEPREANAIVLEVNSGISSQSMRLTPVLFAQDGDVIEAGLDPALAGLIFVRSVRKDSGKIKGVAFVVQSEVAEGMLTWKPGQKPEPVTWNPPLIGRSLMPDGRSMPGSPKQPISLASLPGWQVIGKNNITGTVVLPSGAVVRGFSPDRSYPVNAFSGQDGGGHPYRSYRQPGTGPVSYGDRALDGKPMLIIRFQRAVLHDPSRTFQVSYWNGMITTNYAENGGIGTRSKKIVTVRPTVLLVDSAMAPKERPGRSAIIDDCITVASNQCAPGTPVFGIMVEANHRMADVRFGLGGPDNAWVGDPVSIAVQSMGGEQDNHYFTQREAALVPQEAKLAQAAADNAARIAKLRWRDEVEITLPGPVSQGAVSGSGKRWILGGENRTLHSIDMESLTITATWTMRHTDDVWVAGGERVVAYSEEAGSFDIFDARSGNLQKTVSHRFSSGVGLIGMGAANGSRVMLVIAGSQKRSFQVVAYDLEQDAVVASVQSTDSELTDMTQIAVSGLGNEVVLSRGGRLSPSGVYWWRVGDAEIIHEPTSPDWVPGLGPTRDGCGRRSHSIRLAAIRPKE